MSCRRQSLYLPCISLFSRTYDKENGIITLPLSQEDTLLFSELEPVWVQLRLRDNLDNAIASEPMRVNVGEIFKDGVI